VDQREDGIRVIEGPVVDAADPFDPESRTAELSRPGAPAFPGVRIPDPLVPAPGSGLRGWLAAARFVIRRCAVALVLIALIAALPGHFFTGRVDDTVVAAPALFDLLGGFGLLLLPLMWLAYFTASALPEVIGLAAVVAVALPVAAQDRLPGVRTVWRLVAYRLRPLWLWFAAFGVVVQALPVLLSADRLGPGVAVPLAVVFGLASVGVFTLTGVLGCVVLVERGQGPRRALHLLSRVSAGPLVVASMLLVVLPRLGQWAWGDFGSTAATVIAVQLWAVAALITYAQARAADGPVTSGSLLRELAVPDAD
jgi:hypothetical protein